MRDNRRITLIGKKKVGNWTPGWQEQHSGQMFCFLFIQRRKASQIWHLQQLPTCGWRGEKGSPGRLIPPCNWVGVLMTTWGELKAKSKEAKLGAQPEKSSQGVWTWDPLPSKTYIGGMQSRQERLLSRKQPGPENLSPTQKHQDGWSELDKGK